MKNNFLEFCSILLVFILFLLFSFKYIINFNSVESGLEIESKWLIDLDNITYDFSEMDKYSITQTYINYSPEIRVRRIEHNGEVFYTMTIKRYINEDALTREETEFYITEEEYLNTVVRGLDNTILKDRYQLENDGLIYCFDIFYDDLEGLAYLEIEFDNEEEANNFVEPDWVIQDVTNDRRFKNQSLAQFGVPIDK